MLKWRKHNKHNFTQAKNIFSLEKVSVGNYTYGPIEILYDNGAGRLTIGNYCSIAKDVKFFLGGGHNYRRISTYPFQTRVYNGVYSKYRDEDLDIIVEDDVWIGYDVIIFPGARIRKGSVIGARAIVIGEVPPYSVYIGNKVVKKRFSDEIINKLEQINYNEIKQKKNDVYEKWCTTEVTHENVDELLSNFIVNNHFNG